MLRKFDYSWLLLKRSLWLILPIAGIGMAESKLGQQRCTNLVISIQGDSGTRFLNQMDVQMLLTENGGDPLIGSRLSDVALHDLENRVNRNKLIKKCQVFRDLRGNIVVEVEQEKPLARWINTSDNGEMRNTSGYYINHEGVFSSIRKLFSKNVTGFRGVFPEPSKAEVRKGRSGFGVIAFSEHRPVLESTGYANECG